MDRKEYQDLLHRMYYGESNPDISLTDRLCSRDAVCGSHDPVRSDESPSTGWEERLQRNLITRGQSSHDPGNST